MLSKKVIIYILIGFAALAAVPLSKYGYIEYKRYTITKQWQKDVELYKRGIKHDIPLAMYGLGYAYHTGHGVPRDHVKAKELYKQAADRGEALAQYNLGFMYHNGEGGDKDINKAIFYYQQAADQDYTVALITLSKMYSLGKEVNKNTQRAKELNQKGVENFGKSISYRNQYKQIIKYQLGEF